MHLLTIFRNQYNINLFNELLINGIKYGDEILMCSGFFQENFRNSSYMASQEHNFITNLMNHTKVLKTIGVYNNIWKQSYINFVNNIRSTGVNIIPKIIKSGKWHAKIFIVFENSIPVFCIIGSSNITNSAFSLNKKFNYEADIVIWTSRKITKDINKVLKGKDANNFIQSKVVKNKVTIEDRINNLINEIDFEKLNILEL
jgi:phosphatidylserine/phosphatidylglycerophosphate/cardiolipin synthase-like enzyme